MKNSKLSYESQLLDVLATDAKLSQCTETFPEKVVADHYDEITAKLKQLKGDLQLKLLRLTNYRFKDLALLNSCWVAYQKAFPCEDIAEFLPFDEQELEQHRFDYYEYYTAYRRYLCKILRQFIQNEDWSALREWVNVHQYRFDNFDLMKQCMNQNLPEELAVSCVSDDYFYAFRAINEIAFVRLNFDSPFTIMRYARNWRSFHTLKMDDFWVELIQELIARRKWETIAELVRVNEYKFTNLSQLIVCLNKRGSENEGRLVSVSDDYFKAFQPADKTEFMKMEEVYPKTFERYRKLHVEI